MTRVDTTRFGALELEDGRILDFPEGVPGLPGKRYALVADTKSPGVAWLQSLEDPSVALCLLDAGELAMEYRAEPKTAELRPILPEGGAIGRLEKKIIVRTGERPGEIFLNLFAPIFVDLERRLGMQVPLVGSGYSVREAFPPRPPEPAAEAPED